MKYKKYIITFIIIIIVAVLLMWSIGTYINLKYGILVSADRLYIEQVSYEDGVVKIKGSLSDSAYIISRYVLQEKDDIVYLSIYQGFFENEINPTPYIDYHYKVPDNINEICLLGAHNTKRIVWSRK